MCVVEVKGPWGVVDIDGGFAVELVNINGGVIFFNVDGTGGTPRGRISFGMRRGCNSSVLQVSVVALLPLGCVPALANTVLASTDPSLSV